MLGIFVIMNSNLQQLKEIEKRNTKLTALNDKFRNKLDRLNDSVSKEEYQQLQQTVETLKNNNCENINQRKIIYFN